MAARDTSELARTALKELDLAIGLFDGVAQHPVSKNGLVSSPSAVLGKPIIDYPIWNKNNLPADSPSASRQSSG